MPFNKQMMSLAAAGRKAMGGLRAGYSIAGASTSMRGAMYGLAGGMQGGVIGRAAGLAGRGMMGAGRAMTSVSQMSNAGMMGVTGALAGGAYGAMSDNTSVLGGALMGAGIGAGAVGAAKLGRQGMATYNAMSVARMGRRAAAGGALSAMGKMSKGFIGSSYNRALNGFRGLSR